MDDADRAQIAIEAQLADQIERAASLARQALGRHATSSDCADCDGEIEPERLAHGFAICAACAKDRERRGK